MFYNIWVGRKTKDKKDKKKTKNERTKKTEKTKIYKNHIAITTSKR